MIASAVSLLAAAGARADLPAGSLDPAFGDGGVAQAGALGSPFYDVAAYDSGPDRGKVVAASATSYPPYNVVLARFDENGDLDPSFGANGVVTRSLDSAGTGPVAYGRTGEVAIDPSGGILVTAYDGVLGRAVLARFTEAGALDDGGGQPGAGFGHCGCGFADVGPGLMGFAVTEGGEIAYVTRDTPSSATPDRYVSSAGSLSADGEALWRRQIALGPHPEASDDHWSDNATAITAGPGGDLTLVGWRFPVPVPAGELSDNHLGVVRLHSDGSSDESFATGGGVTLEIASRGAPADQPGSVALDSAGRTVVGGSVSLPGTECSGWVARVTSAGALDQSFAGDGVASFTSVRPEEVATDDRDRVLASGDVNCRAPISNDLGVVRLGGDGILDPFFGSGGAAFVGPTVTEHNSGWGLALTDRGVVVGGYVGVRSAVARFLLGPPGPGGSGGVAGASSSPQVDVHRIRSVKGWRKLIKPGVRVLASCDADCRIRVTVKVSRATARSAGLPTRVVARGTAMAKAGVPVWVRATPPGKIARLLRSFGGRGHLRISVSAEAPT